MATIKKNAKTGLWYYRIPYKKPDGTHASKYKTGFRTKREAEIHAIENQKLLNSPEYVKLKESSKPFAEYFKQWVSLYKPNISLKTKNNYNITAKLINQYFGLTPLNKITEQSYTAFIHWYGFGKKDTHGNWIDKPHSIETVAKVNIHCKACIKRAVKLGHLDNNFAEDIEHVGAVPKKENHLKFLNEAEQNKLRKELISNPINKNGFANIFILLSLATGLRFSECSGLTWDCIDWNKHSIKISKTWDFSIDNFGPTKNDSSNRIISIDKNTLSYLKLIREYQLQNGINHNNLVFIDKFGKLQSNNAINKALKKTLKKAHISTRITHHGLRHTHISWLLFKKINIKWIAKRVGHSTVSTTLDTYSHIIDEMDQLENKTVVDLLQKSYSIS